MRNLHYEIFNGKEKVATVKTYNEAKEAKDKGFKVKEIFTNTIDEKAIERNRKAREKRLAKLAEKNKA